MRNWRLIISGSLGGAFNMALDEAILTLISRESLVVRLYEWEPLCVSIGRFQSIDRTVDLDMCKEMALDVVRRPTGGRAVLHEHQLCYALICSLDDPLAQGRVSDAYRRISDILTLGLHALGLDPCLAAKSPGRAPAHRVGGAACVQTRNEHEILIDGRKIGGGAQLRTSTGMLQHGFLMREFSAERTARVLRPRKRAGAPEDVQSLRTRATSVREALGRPVRPAEVTEAIARGFMEALGPGGDAASPTDAEIRLAMQLVNDKYGRSDWTFVH